MDDRSQCWEQHEFDLIVIGGGIQGCTLAWTASRSGLRVALFERDDFASAASANSLKIVHGGLRYLQQLDLPRMRESIRARRRSLALQPHLVHPHNFAIPTKGYALRSKLALWAAMLANDIISFDRNTHLAHKQHIRRGQLKKKNYLDQIGQHFSNFGNGAAVWQDGFAENTERFALGFALTAEELGATTANHAEVLELLLDGNAVCGVKVRNKLTGVTCDVKGRQVVNASGAWMPKLEEKLPESSRKKDWRWTRGYNLIVDKKLVQGDGVGLDCHCSTSTGKKEVRSYFMAPWRGMTIIGTLYRKFTGNPNDAKLEPAEIQSFIDEINEIYPEGQLTAADVVFAHMGVLPAGSDGEHPSRDTELIDYSKKGCPGYWALKVVKYTTAIEWAERITKRICKKLHKDHDMDAISMVYGGEQPMDTEKAAVMFNALDATFDNDVPAWHAAMYGSRLKNVIKLIEKDTNLGKRLGIRLPVLAADVIYAIRNEHAQTLNDILFRRCEIGQCGWPGEDTINSIATLMAKELNWDRKRLGTEIESVKDVYRKLGIIEQESR